MEPTNLDHTHGSYYEKFIKRLESIHEKAHDNLVNTKIRTKCYYDRKLRPNELKVGNEVYRLKTGARKKLHPYEEGSFEIIDVFEKHNNAIIKYKKGKEKKVHLDKLRLAII